MIADIIDKTSKNAYVFQKPKNEMFLHTDLGLQYTSQDFKDLTLGLNIIKSVSCKRCPYDNACIESFHATLKKEEVYQTTYVPLNRLESLCFNILRVDIIDNEYMDRLINT